MFAEPDINTRGVGRIRDSYANLRRSRIKSESDFENFIVVIKCKKYLEKRLLRILLHNILLSLLELPRRGRLTH